MASDYSTVHQHEPLRAPSNWSADERRLVAQLEEILDDIYSWRNRLKITDFSKEVQTQLVTVTSLSGGGTTEIDGGRVTTGKISAERIDVDHLEVKLINGVNGTFEHIYAAFANGQRIELGQRQIGEEMCVGVFFSTANDSYIMMDSQGVIHIKNAVSGVQIDDDTPLVVGDVHYNSLTHR